MTKIALIVAEGFEEIELCAPFDIFKRAGFTVQLFSLNGQEYVRSQRYLTLKSDAPLTEDALEEFDIVFLPGGGEGTANMLKSDLLARALISAASAGKLLAAVCAAPRVLAGLGLFKGKSATSYPGVREHVEPYCGKYVTEAVVEDQNCITSQGAGTSAEMAFYITAKYYGAEAAQKLRKEMIFN